MQRVDRRFLVLEGYFGPVGVFVTVDQDLITVLGLDEGPSLRVGVDIDEFFKAPLVGLAVEARDQTHL